MARSLRQDTRAIVVNTRQLVSAVSGVTMAINALARGVEDGVQAMVRALNASGPRAEQSGTRDGGEASTGEMRAGREERTVGETCNLHRRKPQVTNVMLALQLASDWGAGPDLVVNGALSTARRYVRRWNSTWRRLVTEKNLHTATSRLLLTFSSNTQQNNLHVRLKSITGIILRHTGGISRPWGIHRSSLQPLQDGQHSARPSQPMQTEENFIHRHKRPANYRNQH